MGYDEFKDTPVYYTEDCIEYILDHSDLDYETIIKVLELEECYMSELGLFVELEGGNK